MDIFSHVRPVREQSKHRNECVWGERFSLAKTTLPRGSYLRDSISVLFPGRLRERVLFELVGEDGDEVIGGESERRKVGEV